MRHPAFSSCTVPPCTILAFVSTADPNPTTELASWFIEVFNTIFECPSMVNRHVRHCRPSLVVRFFLGTVSLPDHLGFLPIAALGLGHAACMEDY